MYVAMASRLPLKSYRFLPGFVRDTMRIRRQLGQTAGLAGYIVNAGLAENVRVQVFWSEVARQAPSVYRPCLVHELVTSGTDWRGKPSGVPVDKQPGADREQCRGVESHGPQLQPWRPGEPCYGPDRCQ